MDFSKDQKLKFHIEDLKKETGLNDEEVKKLFIKTYLLDDEDSTAELMSQFLHGKKEK